MTAKADRQWVNFNGTRYAYLHNLQGDIIGIVDQNGNTVVEYRYDAWGKAISKTGSLASTLGTVNPFRYRGYVCDEEAGLYYLRSRYYNPTWGRFLNADVYIADKIIGLNLFAYCYNNPTYNSDSTGNSKWFDLGQNHRYRIDFDSMNNPDHIHIEGPDGKEWKQKVTGEPYEPNHKTTKQGDPPNWVRKLLKKDKDNDDNDKTGGGGTGGPGWDWDANKVNYKKEQNNKRNAVVEGAVVAGEAALGVGIIYGLYRIVRMIPSLAPPLWWTIPANLAIP